MLIYEVNLEVNEDINFKFAGWLPGHIEKMLRFPGFQAVHWYFRKPEDEDRIGDGKTLWTIHYFIEDRHSLDTYLKEYAQGMRQEAKDLFGDKFSATRRVLNLLSVAGYPLESQVKPEHPVAN